MKFGILSGAKLQDCIIFCSLVNSPTPPVHFATSFHSLHFLPLSFTSLSPPLHASLDPPPPLHFATPFHPLHLLPLSFPSLLPFILPFIHPFPFTLPLPFTLSISYPSPSPPSSPSATPSPSPCHSFHPLHLLPLSLPPPMHCAHFESNT